MRLGCMRNTDKSAVVGHVHDQVVQHKIDCNSVRIVDPALRRTERKMREAFAVHQTKPLMNRDAGLERSKTWNAIL